MLWIKCTWVNNRSSAPLQDSVYWVGHFYYIENYGWKLQSDRYGGGKFQCDRFEFHNLWRDAKRPMQHVRSECMRLLHVPRSTISSTIEMLSGTLLPNLLRFYFVQVISIDGTHQIASLMHQWDNTLHDYNLLITFPADTDIKLKSLLLGAAFLLVNISLNVCRLISTCLCKRIRIKKYEKVDWKFVTY